MTSLPDTKAPTGSLDSLPQTDKEYLRNLLSKEDFHRLSNGLSVENLASKLTSKRSTEPSEQSSKQLELPTPTGKEVTNVALQIKTTPWGGSYPEQMSLEELEKAMDLTPPQPSGKPSQEMTKEQRQEFLAALRKM